MVGDIMERTDYYILFDNFDELADYDEVLATELLEDVGEGEWQDGELRLYYDFEYYAEYEIYEGFYAALFGIYGEPNWNGAPNLFQYVDLQELGEALSASWDDSAYWTDGTVIIETSYGW